MSGDRNALVWTQQPQTALGAAPHLVEGLKVLWNPAVGDGTINLANPIDPPTISFTVLNDVRSNARGRLVGTGGNSDGFYWPTTSGASQWTVFVNLEFTSQTGNQGYLQWAGAGVNSANPRLLLQNDTSNLTVYWNSNYRITESGVGLLGSRHSIVARFDGTTLFYYRNGLRYTYVGGATNAGTHIWFGSGYLSGGRCSMFAGAWWERAIDDGDAMEISLNPWSVFSPLFRRTHDQVVGSPNYYYQQQALVTGVNA